MLGILWGIVVVLVILWAIGFAFHVLGAAIHVLIVIAIIIALYNLFFGGRRSVV